LGYTVNCFERADEATAYLCEKLQGRSVGFAGSMSLEKMGLYEQLSKTATVYWHHRIPEGKTSREVRTQANAAPVYITSVNAVAESGEIVNIDANCNRVASIFYGHDKVYFVIGKNKITKTYDEAVYRARNIAAPLNAKRLGVNTPCAVKADRCYDCKSPQRICRGLSVLWAPPMTGEFEILLINEDLGY
jgi:L-lactate utilization protein LutC